MSSFLFKNSQNYQIGYLNALIHGLLTASSTFEIYSSVENKFSNAEISRIISGEIHIDEFIHECLLKYEGKEQQNRSLIP